MSTPRTLPATDTDAAPAPDETSTTDDSASPNGLSSDERSPEGDSEPGEQKDQLSQASMVVVANRLPFDLETLPDGSTKARQAPGGLVTALAPILSRREGAWIG